MVIDLDSTIADLQHRLHFILTQQWSESDKIMDMDKPKIDIITLVNDALVNFQKAQPDFLTQIIFLTGRHDGCRKITEDWLRSTFTMHEKLKHLKMSEYVNLRQYHLLMRVKGNWEDVGEFKARTLNSLKSEYDLKFFIDDDPRNCHQYRRMFPEATVLQVV